MNEADKRIGENLSRLRGDMSQAALSAAMRERGWKWSQPTVAAIEKGERPVKLAEAESLLDILELLRLEEMTTKPLESIWWSRMSLLSQAHDRLVGATTAFLNARAALAEAADDLVAAGQELPEGPEESAFWIQLAVHDVTHRSLPMWLAPGESDGEYSRMLFESDYGEFARHALARFEDEEEAVGVEIDTERSYGAPADAAE